MLCCYPVIAALMDSVRNEWVKINDKEGYKRKNSREDDKGRDQTNFYRMHVRGKTGTGKTYRTPHASSLRFTLVVACGTP